MVSGVLMCKDGDTSEKEAFIRGIFILVSVMSVVAYLVFRVYSFRIK